MPSDKPNDPAGEKKIRKSQEQLFSEVREERWQGFTAEQKAFLSSQEISQEGDLWVLKENETRAWLSGVGKLIQLTMIQTPPEQRGNGDAGRLLAKICKLADQVGAVLTLKAQPKDAVIGLNLEQLVAWYRKHGFEGKPDRMTRNPE